MEKIFVPHELKTIEVNAEKKIFRINGEDFGKECTGFSIHCKDYKNYWIHVEVDTTVHFATYGEHGVKTGENQYETNTPYFSPAVTKSDKDAD